MKETLKRAYGILKKTVYSTVATTSEDGSPWAAPQFTVYDPEAKAVYWCAWRDSQHGRNILNNGKACITVYDSMAAPGEGEGVYLQTQATIVGDPKEQASIYEQLIAKHAAAPYWQLHDMQRADAEVVIFKATVDQSWINCEHEKNGQFVISREPVAL